MNVEIGAEAVQFPEKEYINGIAVAVHTRGLSGFLWILPHNGPADRCHGYYYPTGGKCV
jgi:hypothetical protein